MCPAVEEGLGREVATLLMEYLDTFATKQDIETVVDKVEFAEFKAEIKVAMANLESRLHSDLRTTVLVLVGTNIALIGGAVAFLRAA